MLHAKMKSINKRTFQVVDETVALVGSMVLSAVSDPAKLARIMAALLGVAFIGLLLGNSVTLAGIPLHRCSPAFRFVDVVVVSSYLVHREVLFATHSESLFSYGWLGTSPLPTF